MKHERGSIMVSFSLWSRPKILLKYFKTRYASICSNEYINIICVSPKRTAKLVNAVILRKQNKSITKENYGWSFKFENYDEFYTELQNAYTSINVQLMQTLMNSMPKTHWNLD